MNKYKAGWGPLAVYVSMVVIKSYQGFSSQLTSTPPSVMGSMLTIVALQQPFTQVSFS